MIGVTNRDSYEVISGSPQFTDGRACRVPSSSVLKSVHLSERDPK